MPTYPQNAQPQLVSPGLLLLLLLLLLPHDLLTLLAQQQRQLVRAGAAAARSAALRARPGLLQVVLVLANDESGWESRRPSARAGELPRRY